jgi:hypothetical protein
MAFPLQDIPWQHSSRRESVDQQNVLRTESGGFKIHRKHRTQPFLFEITWDHLTAAQADSAWAHFIANKTTADSLTWEDGVSYIVSYTGTPDRRRSDGFSAGAKLYRFSCRLQGRRL